jgi:hypothetical protein
MFFFLWPIDGPLLIQLALLKSKTLDKQISIKDWSKKKHHRLGKQPGLFDLLRESLAFQEALAREWLAAILEAKRPVMAKAELRDEDIRRRA